MRSDKPCIAVHKNRVTFNSALYKLAELEKNRYVDISFYDEARELGFKFSKEKGEDSYKVVMSETTLTGKTITSTPYSSCAKIHKKPWVKKIADSKEHNTIIAKKDPEGKWIIILTPIFEISSLRADSKEIPLEAKGIYRYLDKEEVVYIGKGCIRERLYEPQRKEWKFDTIEYSIIKDEQDAFDWETYWLEKYERDNKCLPFYNKIGGKPICLS